MSQKQTVLITGGTGFLGRELGQKLKDHYQVILGARNNKQNHLIKQMTGCEVTPLDITNIESVRDAVVAYRPEIIVHAAATKFVDLSEKFPMECIDVNVVGSQHIARVAMDKGVKTVIGISTDKASPPVRNTYGMSKAIMERMFCSSNGKSETKFTCVRYGNVAWSTGSVLPIWRKMHSERGVIGTTGPEMRRFFFTVEDAVALVIVAMNHIDEVAGMVLSREMKAAQIQDILTTWTKLYGGRFERIEGRPGERMDEFLIGELELPYTREIFYDKVRHFLISFNEKVETPVSVGLSSENASKLTEQEIAELISNRPSFE
ncbi:MULTISPECIES: polysaccharide biosynthesis protein [unclassified Imperialibacter]|uniref:polysaccharide biosynthesis protein n=1 Tax=unclassified Imperialibacter TaxID=2629706 RepID=UPI001254C3DA|nr:MULTISPECIES: polysaccharide biosynthesis protein [unclassified Imperialibacter]CAD5259234.1 UDP-glucose 4-epimerase [Imperialibacter sp. 89]CAD5280069.1 UDP-glucose 4-epimerase [Imperialibacter sp. 75]VVT31811.1 UDP-glucose 4-epimerase [Imperialibacter sp. EC-SDR9]